MPNQKNNSQQPMPFFDASFGDGAFDSSHDLSDDTTAWTPWPDNLATRTSSTTTTTKQRMTKASAPLRRPSPRSDGSSRSSSLGRNREGDGGALTSRVQNTEGDSMWVDSSGFGSIMPNDKKAAMDFPNDWISLSQKSSTFLEEQQRLADSKSNDWGVRHTVSGETDDDSKDAWNIGNNLSLSHSISPPSSVEDGPSNGAIPRDDDDDGIWETTKLAKNTIRRTGKEDPMASSTSLADHRTRRDSSKNNNSVRSKSNNNCEDSRPVVVETTNLATSPRKLSLKKQSTVLKASPIAPIDPTESSSLSKAKGGGTGAGLMGRIFGVSQRLCQISFV